MSIKFQGKTIAGNIGLVMDRQIYHAILQPDGKTYLVTEDLSFINNEIRFIHFNTMNTVVNPVLSYGWITPGVPGLYTRELRNWNTNAILANAIPSDTVLTVAMVELEGSTLRMLFPITNPIEYVNAILDLHNAVNIASHPDIKDSIGDINQDLLSHKDDVSNPHVVTKEQVGLGNVENKNSSTIRSEITSQNVEDALGFVPVDAAHAGQPGGFPTLDNSGKVPSTQLPSYVDDIVEIVNFVTTIPSVNGYNIGDLIYSTTLKLLKLRVFYGWTTVNAESGKIYVNLDTNKTYRWTGSDMGVVSETIALGETSSTAYRGDRGKVAYDHSQTTHDKAFVGLNNVDNTSDANKPISVATQQALNLKVNTVDLSPVFSIDIDRLGYFDTLSKTKTTPAFIGELLTLANNSGYNFPLMVGIRYGYDGGKSLSLTDFPVSGATIVDFDGYAIVYGNSRAYLQLHRYLTPALADNKKQMYFGIYRNDAPTEFTWIPMTDKNYVDGVIAGTIPIVYNNSVSQLAATTVQAAIDEIDGDLDTHIGNKVVAWQATPDDTHYPSEKLVDDRITPIEANVEVLQIDNATKSKQIADIEETLRKSMSGEVTGTANGTAIVSLGKDVANAPLQVKVDGGLIPALTNLVTNGNFSNGTTGWNILNISSFTVNDNIATWVSDDLNISPQFYKLNVASNVPQNTVYYVITHAKVDSSIAKLRIRIELVLSGANEYVYNLLNPNPNTWYKMSAGFKTDIDDKTLLLNLNPLKLNATDIVTVQYKNIQLFNLTALYGVTATSGTAYDNAVAEIEAMLALKGGYISSTPIHAVSMNKRVRSVGKNLFDKSQYATSYAYKIKVKPSTAYVWSSSTAYKTYDINMVEVASGTATTFTTGSGTYYIAFSGISNIDTFQLEQGSTATTYEPYVNTDMYLQANALGYKLPNGVADTIEYRNGKYWYVNRVSKVAVVGVVAVNTTNYPLAKNTGQFINYLTAGGSEVGVVGTNSTSGNGTLYYELATPIETEILSSGNLNGYQNGTVYIDDVMQDADIYATNATVTNTDYPIKTLEKIVKINSDGSQTDLVVSGATVASGGLSFTHTSLTSGDKVWFSYVYDVDDLFKSKTTVTFYDSKTTVTDSVTAKVYKITPAIASGVLSWTLTEV